MLFLFFFLLRVTKKFNYVKDYENTKLFLNNFRMVNRLVKRFFFLPFKTSSLIFLVKGKNIISLLQTTIN